MTRTIAPLMAAAVAGLGLTAGASARPKHPVAARTIYDSSDISSLPLTVNRRSWLDPGPVAPRGTGTNYVTANTQLNKTPDQVIDPDQFGNASLPGQPYVPGRSQPVVEFSTTPTGRVDVANELLPQNFYFNPASPRPPANYQPSFSPETPDAP